LIGGHEDKLVSKRVYKYSTTQEGPGHWEELPSLLEARVYFEVVTTEKGIYALGGYDGENVLSSVEFYSFESGKWEK